MNLLKEEKKFWKRHFRIEKLDAIPPVWSGYKSIDSENDDGFFYFFTLRVSSISEIYLKDTLVTDEGVKHIAKLKDLENLCLRSHSKITKASIPFFNEMASLQSLNITKTGITLADLCDDLNNQSLKEVFLDSEDDEESLLEKAILLKERMPACNFYLNSNFTTDVFGNPVKPIC
tara:strand:- start:20241 stop:20765 length:525 start_codon:yes stop_codon:yes gene_type:complete